MTHFGKINASTSKKIPIIIDTDIGTEIDDFAALIMALKSPELDIQLILTSSDDTLCRAKFVAKLLEIANRTEIPVGIGIPLFGKNVIGPEDRWVKGFNLNRYKGIIYPDGISALKETIINSEEKLTIISIGPLANISNALNDEPDIVSRSRFIGMQGCIQKGYKRDESVSKEYNVSAYPLASQKVFSAAWEILIAPLDSCRQVQFSKESYYSIRKSNDPLISILLDNYRYWIDRNHINPALSRVFFPPLYDTVAIYLAFSDEYLQLAKHKIRVTDEGYTVVDETAREITCAIEWKNLQAFEELLLRRLLSS